MNFLIENTPDVMHVGGVPVKFKTDFSSWVKFLIAVENGDNVAMSGCINDIFGQLPECSAEELIKSIVDWLWQGTESNGDSKGESSGRCPYDWSKDGNVIFCELWEHFPHLMERGVSFPQGMELLKILMSKEDTQIHHRAYARCGDFSKLGREQRNYWLKERSKYGTKISQKSIDDVFANGFV